MVRSMKEITNQEQLNMVSGGLCICSYLGGGIGAYADGRIHLADTCHEYCCYGHKAHSWWLSISTKTNPYGISDYCNTIVKPKILNTIELRSGNSISHYCKPYNWWYPPSA